MGSQLDLILTNTNITLALGRLTQRHTHRVLFTKILCWLEQVSKIFRYQTAEWRHHPFFFSHLKKQNIWTWIIGRISKVFTEQRVKNLGLRTHIYSVFTFSLYFLNFTIIGSASAPYPPNPSHEVNSSLQSPLYYLLLVNVYFSGYTYTFNNICYL